MANNWGTSSLLAFSCVASLVMNLFYPGYKKISRPGNTVLAGSFKLHLRPTKFLGGVFYMEGAYPSYPCLFYYDDDLHNLMPVHHIIVYRRTVLVAMASSTLLLILPRDLWARDPWAHNQWYTY